MLVCGVTLQSKGKSPQRASVLDGDAALEYIGQREFSLSGSYQLGYSTAYNTQSHIKVVCNGYILTHLSNCNS